MINLIALGGSPVMCILTITTKTRNLVIENRIYINITPDGNTHYDSDNFFSNKSGPGKCSPVPPPYLFCGKLESSSGSAL